MNKPRIVFMGTPDFAVGILKLLVLHEYKIVGVITAPDRKSGRGLKVNESAVKKYAKSIGLPILQPTNLKSQEFQSKLKELDGDLQIVVAFRMLPKSVWNLPKLGTFNLHASLLPSYRGAAPINWAIINGEVKTGVTTFFIDDKIDTGEIILQRTAEISQTDTAGSLHDKLMILGAEVVLKTVKLISNNKVKRLKQPEFAPKKAPKIYKNTCEIDWSKDIHDIYNFIRGLNPYPAAWTTLKMGDQSYPVKIYDVKYEEVSHDLEIGKILSTKTELKVAVKNGFINVLGLQIAGKRKLATKSLLNGFTIKEDSIMS